MIRTPGMWEAAEKRMAGISPPAPQASGRGSKGTAHDNLEGLIEAGAFAALEHELAARVDADTDKLREAIRTGEDTKALRTVQRIRRSGGGPALLQPLVDAWGAPVPEPVGKRRR